MSLSSLYQQGKNRLGLDKQDKKGKNSFIRSRLISQNYLFPNSFTDEFLVSNNTNFLDGVLKKIEIGKKYYHSLKGHPKLSKITMSGCKLM